MIVSSLLAAALILNVSASDTGDTNNTPFGPSYVKGIDIGVAKLTPTTDMLLFQPSNADVPPFKIEKIHNGIEDITMGVVLACIDCSLLHSVAVQFVSKSNVRGTTEFAEYATCQVLFEHAIAKLDIRVAQPDKAGKSLLDYVVEKYIAHVNRKTEPEASEYTAKTEHFVAVINQLANFTFQHSLYTYATIVWNGGNTSVQQLIQKKQFAAAAEFLNLGFYIPQGALLFVELVEFDVEVLKKPFGKFFKTLSTDNLVMLASWPKLVNKHTEMLNAINLRPLTLGDQRKLSMINAENMYRIGQYYEYLRRAVPADKTLNFYDDFNNDQAKLIELQPFTNKNWDAKYFNAIHSYIGTLNTKFSDFNSQWQKIVEFKGFETQFSSNTFAYFKNFNIHLNSVYTAYTVKSAENYSYNGNEEPIITYLANNGMFDAITPLLQNVEWKNLHNADKQTLLMLAANKYISPEFVSNMATKGMLTAKLIQSELLANPMLNIAHVSDEAKKTLLKEAGAEGLISILQGRKTAEPSLVSQTISKAISNSTQLTLLMAKYKLPIWIEYEVIAINASTAENVAEDKVKQYLEPYFRLSTINLVLLYQAFTNASLAIPVFDPVPSEHNIPWGMYFASYVSCGKDGNVGIDNTAQTALKKAFNNDNIPLATVANLADLNSVALKSLPEFGSPQSASTLTYVFYVLILVVCIVVAVVGARILMTEDSDRRSSSASSVESRDIEAGPAAAEPEAKPALQDDAGRLEETSSSTEPTPEKSQV